MKKEVDAAAVAFDLPEAAPTSMWKPLLAPRRFAIRDHDSLGELRGVVETQTYLQAAEYAAREYYQAPAATRFTGWEGADGVWHTYSNVVGAAPLKPIFFHVHEVGRTINAAPTRFPPPEPKAAAAPPAKAPSKKPTKPLKAKRK